MKTTIPSYSISLVPFVPWAVYVVADTQGIWQNLGLDIRTRIHKTEETYVDDIINDESDFYPLPLASTVDLFNRGKPLIYLGMLDHANGHKHLVIKTECLDQPLRGQTIGLYADESTNRHLVARFLKTRGLSLADVTLITLDEQSLAEEFIRGDLNVVLAFREIKEKITTEGPGTVVFTTADYVDPFGLTVARDRFDQIPQADLGKLYQGRFQALQWMADPVNWNAFENLVNDIVFDGFPDLTAETINNLLAEIAVPDRSALLRINQTEFRTIFNECKETVEANQILDQTASDQFTFEQVVRNEALLAELAAIRT